MNDRHQIAPYPIRMPAELRAQLEDAAKAGNRSLHAEIIARLQSTFAAPTEEEAIAQPTLAKLMKDVESIKERLNKAPIHVRIRSDGALNIFGFQMWTYDYLFKRGVEGENKHDHLFINKDRAKEALALLEASSTFIVRTSESDSDDFVLPQ